MKLKWNKIAKNSFKSLLETVKVNGSNDTAKIAGKFQRSQQLDMIVPRVLMRCLEN